VRERSPAADEPQMVLLDLGPPDLDEIAVLRELTALGSNVPVIAMSDRPTQLLMRQRPGRAPRSPSPLTYSSWPHCWSATALSKPTAHHEWQQSAILSAQRTVLHEQLSSADG
jgi:CheY-like chemotaxis protein